MKLMLRKDTGQAHCHALLADASMLEPQSAHAGYGGELHGASGDVEREIMRLRRRARQLHRAIA